MSDLANEIRSAVARHMDAGEISGAITLVARHGEVEVLEAQGTVEHGSSTPLQTDTVFYVMSMTKPVAAACAAMLVDEGKLSLDRPLSDYIPEFARPRQVRTLKPGQAFPPFPPRPGQPPAAEPEFDFAPAERPILLHDLMNFTSGLQTLGVDNKAIPAIQPTDTLATFVPKLADAPLDFQPGARWHYSNMTGYDVLGRIIEVASGMTFGDFFKERLADPLGMTDTQFGPNPDHLERTLPLGMIAGSALGGQTYHSGSGGLFSTATDYGRFAQMLLGKGAYKGRQVMSAKAVEMMTKNQIGDLVFGGLNPMEYAGLRDLNAPGLRYGYGVALVADGKASGLSLPTGSFGWDGIGTRRFWVIPALDTVLVMLIPGMIVGQPTHNDIEAIVCNRS